MRRSSANRYIIPLPYRGVLFLFLITAVCYAQTTQKWTFEGGIGPTFPVASARDRWNTGWNLDFGGGYKLNPHFSGLLEIGYNHFNLSDTALLGLNQPAGYTKFWNFSLSPRYDFMPEKKVDFYVTGGYGLYIRSLAFTDPSQAGAYCDPYYGFCDYGGAPVTASYTNYKGGWNSGGGVTYAMGSSGLKFFTDVRYNRVLSHFNNEFITLRFGLRF